MTWSSWRGVWVSLLLVPAMAFAAQVYTWEDDSGTLHFADQPPAGKTGVERRIMRPAAPIHDGGPASSEEAGDVKAEGLPDGGLPSGQTQEGPAKVLLVSRDATPVGPQQRELSGTVKNVGGNVANGVTVVIQITDAGQGTPCISGEIPVDPSSLEPGQEGRYSDYVDTPCFLGNAGISVQPAWD